MTRYVVLDTVTTLVSLALAIDFIASGARDNSLLILAVLFWLLSEVYAIQRKQTVR